MMRVFAITALLLLAPAAVLAVDEARLAGRWKVVEMRIKGKRVKRSAKTQIIMSFKRAGHRWSVTVKAGRHRQREVGTWRLRGDRLTTRSRRGKARRLRVRLRGNSLQLTSGAEQLLLRRL